MAVLKRRLYRLNDEGVYNIIHFETSADVVVRADGSATVEQSLIDLGKKLDGTTYLQYEVGPDGYEASPFDQINAAYLNGYSPDEFAKTEHKHDFSDILNHPDTIEASKITDGTLAVGVLASNGSDLTTPRLRNIYAGTATLTSGSSALPTGVIYLQYE